MATVMNAMTPYDLYMHPTTQPFPIDYPTIGYNQMGSPDRLGVTRGTTLLSNLSGLQGDYYGNPWQGIRSWEELANQYPSNFPRQLAPQAVYEHEAGHTIDPRLNPQKYNKGYLTRGGLSGEVFNREMPAMKAEDDFWGTVLYNQKNRQQ